MKTIFVTVYDGDTEKNFLRSGVLDYLKSSGAKIVLLIRSEDRVKYYTDNFSDSNVVVELLPPAFNQIERVFYHIGWNSLPTFTAYIKRYDLYLKHRNFLRYSIEYVCGLLGHFRAWRNFLRFVYYHLPDDYADKLFEKYKPDLLFSPNMFSAEDCRLLKKARKLGIKTVTTGKSWDVFTTRAFTRVIADRLLVFNEINREEAINIGDYPANRIKVTGFPQFDIYKNEEIYLSREEFFKKNHLDPSKKLILFAIPGEFKHPYMNEILLSLDKAIEEGKINSSVQILARFHPKYPSAAESLKDLKHIIKDRPGTYFSKNLERSIDAPSSTTFQWTFTDNDIIHLANSIHHSDVTINSESTMTLDAAAHDKPIILIGYDGLRKLDYWRSVIRNYDREHFSAVLETKGARLAKSDEDLISYINFYLLDPAKDREGRDLLQKRLLYKNDNQSARRTAEFIKELL